MTSLVTCTLTLRHWSPTPAPRAHTLPHALMHERAVVALEAYINTLSALTLDPYFGTPSFDVPGSCPNHTHTSSSRARTWFEFNLITWQLALTHPQTAITMSQDPPQQQWLSVHDPATCTRKGLCPVTKSNAQGKPLKSHSLYFEQHGTGPVKIIFISGPVSCVFGLSSRN